jgi:hypothetical protein
VLPSLVDPPSSVVRPATAFVDPVRPWEPRQILLSPRVFNIVTDPLVSLLSPSSSPAAPPGGAASLLRRVVR